MSLKHRKKQYRIIYGVLFEIPRASVNQIKKAVGTRTGNRRLQEAFDQLYIAGPEIRKRSYKNLKEYICFVRCKDPELEYLKLREDQRVCYHAKAIGFCNLWIVSTEEIDIEGDIIVFGWRSDYYTSHAPNRSWKDAIVIIKKKVENFDPAEYEPKGFIKTHWDEMTEWDEKDELLYRYFKYDLRKPLTPVMKKYKITKDKVYSFLDNVSQNCTIFTSYYPQTASAYDPYLFMFKTDYEDFIIELFSELPTSAIFFKVSEYLFVYVHVPKQYMRSTDLQTAKRSYIPLLIMDLAKRGIVKDKAYSVIEYFWGKDI